FAAAPAWRGARAGADRDRDTRARGGQRHRGAAAMAARIAERVCRVAGECRAVEPVDAAGDLPRGATRLGSRVAYCSRASNSSCERAALDFSTLPAAPALR